MENPMVSRMCKHKASPLALRNYVFQMENLWYWYCHHFQKSIWHHGKKVYDTKRYHGKCIIWISGDIFPFQHRFNIQYRHLIPAPVDRTSANAWLYKKPLDKMSKNNPSTRRLRIKATFSYGAIIAPMSRKMDGNRVCGRVLCPGCPRI